MPSHRTLCNFHKSPYDIFRIRFHQAPDPVPVFLGWPEEDLSGQSVSAGRRRHSIPSWGRVSRPCPHISDISSDLFLLSTRMTRIATSLLTQHLPCCKILFRPVRDALRIRLRSPQEEETSRLIWGFHVYINVGHYPRPRFNCRCVVSRDSILCLWQINSSSLHGSPTL